MRQPPREVVELLGILMAVILTAPVKGAAMALKLANHTAAGSIKAAFAKSLRVQFLMLSS